MMGRLAVAAPLVVALGAIATILRRRAVYWLGRRGATIAPSVLLAIWLTGLVVGQATGSLGGMAAVAAVPLVAAAVIARRWTGRRRLFLGRSSWTLLDLAVVALVAGTVIVSDIFDVHCHRAVSGVFLRGNIPPTALNDPRVPLPYHAIFDAIVALLVRALPVDTELALDLITISCVALTMGNLHVLARFSFRTPLAAQLGRVLFFLGFGPTFVRLLSGGSMYRLHGQTTQAFIDMILRRPPALGFVLLTAFLAALAPRFFDRRGPALPSPRFAPHPAWLLPVLFVIPLIAEEAVLHVAIFAAPLLVWRRVSFPWMVAGVVALGLGTWNSGVFAAVFGHASAMAAPHFALAWPPTVPTWDSSRNGIPLLSAGALVVLLTELGPLALATFGLIARKGPAFRRMLLAPLLAGMVVALFGRLDGWNKSDLDRFLFYGTPFSFMLSAVWLETTTAQRWMEQGRGRARKLALGTALVVAGMPTVYAVWNAGKNARSWRHFWRDEPGATLRERMTVVGPRETVLVADAGRAYDLVQAGFVVLAPMTSTSIGEVNGDQMDDYLKANASRADWFFVPEGDARLSGRKIEASIDDYRLVRARP